MLPGDGHSSVVPNPQDFLAAPGRGVAATVEGRHVCVGSPAYVESRNISIESVHERLASMQEAGFTVIAVAIDKQLAGLIAIADQIKPDAGEAILRGFEVSPDDAQVTNV